MRHEDLETADDMRQWNGPILLPFLDCFHVVHKDDEVLFLALVVYLGLVGISSRHCCSFCTML